MFLSRITPSAGFILSSLAQQAHSGDAYAQHQLLWQLFPKEHERRFLFRYEQGREGPCYYVLSPTEPDNTLIGVDVVSKPFRPKLSTGDRLAYTLRANPTRMLKSDSPGGRGERVDVLMHAKHQAKHDPEVDIDELQLEAARHWLIDSGRQQRLGVELTAAPEVTEHRQHQIHKRRNKGGRSNPIQFTSVNYEGVLQVTEPNRFLDHLVQGIGRAKAMGCGLMMIRRY